MAFGPLYRARTCGHFEHLGSAGPQDLEPIGNCFQGASIGRYLYIYIFKYTYIYICGKKTWFPVKLSLNQSIEYHSCCLNSSLYIGLPTPVLVPNPYFGGLNYRFNAPCGSLGVHPHLQDPLGVIPCTPPTAQRCCLVGLFLAPKTEGRE